MAHTNLWKEQFSLAYLRAVAAVAECDVFRTEVDVNKIDVTLRATNDSLFVQSIEVQAKCSARDIERESDVVYPLDVETYDALQRRAANPRILVVATVPERPGDWLRQTNEEMVLHHCGYWVSLEGKAATENTATVSIPIPKTDIFSVAAIRQIFERANQDVTY